MTQKVACDQDRVATRHRRLRLQPQEALDCIDSSDASQSQVFDRAWARLVVREAYDTLIADGGTCPDALRRLQVLRLRYQEGLPPREIARRLAIADVRAVYQMLSTGRTQFRRALTAVMRSYNPSASPSEIERYCRDLLGLL